MLPTRKKIVSSLLAFGLILDWAQWQREAVPAAEELKAHGMVRAVGLPIPGVNAFSAPVFDHEGQAVLVLTALGHQDEVNPAWHSPTARAMVEAMVAWVNESPEAWPNL